MVCDNFRPWLLDVEACENSRPLNIPFFCNVVVSLTCLVWDADIAHIIRMLCKEWYQCDIILSPCWVFPHLRKCLIQQQFASDYAVLWMNDGVSYQFIIYCFYWILWNKLDSSILYLIAAVNSCSLTIVVLLLWNCIRSPTLRIFCFTKI